MGIPRERDTGLKEALDLARQALALDPNDPRVQSTVARMHLAWRHFDAAERHFNLARG